MAYLSLFSFIFQDLFAFLFNVFFLSLMRKFQELDGENSEYFSLSFSMTFFTGLVFVVSTTSKLGFLYLIRSCLGNDPKSVIVLYPI